MINLKKWIFPVFVIVFAVTFAIIMNSFFMIVQVSGNSMLPTLESNDVLFVDKKATANRGDIVVLDVGSDKYIKRVIAIEGDEIYFDEQNFVYLKKAGESEFVKLEETYVLGNSFMFDKITPSESNPLKIEKGGYYVLGDNRGNSEDSRTLGVIDSENINGVVKQSTINAKSVTTFIFGWTFKVKDFISRLLWENFTNTII